MNTAQIMDHDSQEQLISEERKEYVLLDFRRYLQQKQVVEKADSIRSDGRLRAIGLWISSFLVLFVIVAFVDDSQKNSCGTFGMALFLSLFPATLCFLIINNAVDNKSRRMVDVYRDRFVNLHHLCEAEKEIVDDACQRLLQTSPFSNNLGAGEYTNCS